MPPFPKPRSDFDYDLDAEIDALRQHKALRDVPARRDDRLLLGTWNIANFGVQHRREKDHKLIAEILGWFDSQRSKRSPTTSPTCLPYATCCPTATGC